MKFFNILLIFLFSIIILFAATQCTQKYPGNNDSNITEIKGGCINCHLDADKLKKVATPLPPTTGEAGEG